MNSAQKESKIEQIFNNKRSAPQNPAYNQMKYRNCIKVSKKQESNPLLKQSRFHYMLTEDLVEDYDINERTSVLFLSLEYHIAYPLYIRQRFEDLYRQRRHRNKVLILLNDNSDEHNMVD